MHPRVVELSETARDMRTRLGEGFLLFSASLTIGSLMESWFHCSLSNELRDVWKLRSIGYY